MDRSLAQRLLKAMGESTFWKRTGRLHAALYRATNGAIGHSAGSIRNLLLTTAGRKTGVPRTIPLAYMPDSEAFVVVASNGGADRHPSWWLNLQQNPEATVQVGPETIAVRAERAVEAEYRRLWPLLKACNPFFGQYEQITERGIPVVVLRRRI